MSTKLFDDITPELQDYLAEVMPGTAEHLDNYLTTNLRPKAAKSKAKTKGGLFLQCVKWISAEPDVRDLLSACRKSDFDVFALWSEANRATGGRPFPDFEPSPFDKGVTFIDLGFPLIWKIDTNWLDFAIKLWPVEVRKFPSGRPYVVKVVKGQSLPCHRLLETLRDNDVYMPHSFDWMDYSKGNFRIWSSKTMQERLEAKLPVVYPYLTPAGFDNQYLGVMRNGESAQEADGSN